MLNVIMLSVIMLSVIMLNAVMLNAVSLSCPLLVIIRTLQKCAVPLFSLYLKCQVFLLEIFNNKLKLLSTSFLTVLS